MCGSLSGTRRGPACCVASKSPRLGGPLDTGCRVRHRSTRSGLSAPLRMECAFEVRRAGRRCFHTWRIRDDTSGARRTSDAVCFATQRAHRREGVGAAWIYHSGANGRSAYTAVIDPEGIELNRAWLGWEGERLGATLARQRLLFDNQRWTGNGGRRQNKQTFDAVSFDRPAPPALSRAGARAGFPGCAR